MQSPTIKVDKQTHAALKKMSRRTGVPIIRIVRDAVREHLNGRK